jgi:hypothetical protein
MADQAYAFHTDNEAAPWWCVDLEWPAPVREIRLFNRMDHAYRARRLEVSVSLDLMTWRSVYRHQSDADFGGSDGHPLRITFTEPTIMRFIRVSLPSEGMLHLESVHVYV